MNENQWEFWNAFCRTQVIGDSLPMVALRAVELVAHAAASNWHVCKCAVAWTTGAIGAFHQIHRDWFGLSVGGSLTIRPSSNPFVWASLCGKTLGAPPTYCAYSGFENR